MFDMDEPLVALLLQNLGPSLKELKLDFINCSKNGDFSMELIKPYNYLIFCWSMHQISRNLLSTIYQIILLAATYFENPDQLGQYHSLS